MEAYAMGCGGVKMPACKCARRRVDFSWKRRLFCLFAVVFADAALKSMRSSVRRIRVTDFHGENPIVSVSFCRESIMATKREMLQEKTKAQLMKLAKKAKITKVKTSMKKDEMVEAIASSRKVKKADL
jgi:hypothetical protein